MAYSVDWIAKVITIPQSDMSFVSGNNYLLSLVDVHNELRRLEWDFADGLWAPQIAKFYETVTLSGIPKSPSVEFINDYGVDFTGSNYNIILSDYDNNIIDVCLPANGISVLGNNSVGRQTVQAGSGLSTEQDAQLFGIGRKVYIDTEEGINGGGSQGDPFSVLADGIDYSESIGCKELVIYADIILDRLVKNFNVIGVGQPTVDCNNKSLNKSEFWHCRMEGIALGGITVQQGVLLAGFEFSGFIEKCAVEGDIILNGGAHIIESYSNKPGGDYANITTGAHTIQVSDWHRSLGIKGMTGGVHTIEMYGGQLHLDATCTGGTIHLRGNYSLPPEDLSNGTVIIDETESRGLLTSKVEGEITVEQMLRLIASLQSAKVSGMDTDAPVFRDLADTKNRLSAVVSNGNRTTINILDLD